MRSATYILTQLGRIAGGAIMGGARARNIGWRIDYFVVSGVLAPLLKEVDIRSDVTGSDQLSSRNRSETVRTFVRVQKV